MNDLNAAIRDIPIPHRMKRLPISDRGFPIPWFVHIADDGVPDFRVIGADKVPDAANKKLCWLCGQPLGTWFCFTVGPMCVINRTTAEPPEHIDCAEYAVKACPFLANPRMRRNEKDMPEGHMEPGGIMIRRNPGATAIYVTRSYKPFYADQGQYKKGDFRPVLFRMGDPERVHWFKEGRTATRAEVDESIRTGLPFLQDAAEVDGPEGVRELAKAIVKAQPLLPRPLDGPAI